ncbi:PadR family transcriptional regulator [Nocardia tenerifensis]|uniref:PadR family transcriptional regulator n=1 Tax=Nocardia tenerifensis TaxID=228006 RepID=A0A318K0W5_9NOCA|nr:PadR family transcriptional regulator [Nocardia tenerifensis]PXX60435.1 PadR family transcriptional regulator [Nocardia tenerifensis]
MSLRYAMLGLLADHPASGYDLLQRFKYSLANIWSATQSQIYTELTKLAEAELVTVSDEGPRGRKEYSITEAGLSDLRHWLTETEPKQTNRNELLLRVFFLGVIPRARAEEYLTGIATWAAEGHAELISLEESIDWDDDEFSRNGHLALEWGKRFFAMNKEWAEWAKKQKPYR